MQFLRHDLRRQSCILSDEAAALDAVEGVAPRGALLNAVCVHPRAAHAEQGLVLEIAPNLRRDISSRALVISSSNNNI